MSPHDVINALKTKEPSPALFPKERAKEGYKGLDYVKRTRQTDQIVISPSLISSTTACERPFTFSFCMTFVMWFERASLCSM
jgi:hypothetical protein